jgi:hypothetical protein
MRRWFVQSNFPGTHACKFSNFGIIHNCLSAIHSEDYFLADASRSLFFYRLDERKQADEGHIAGVSGGVVLIGSYSFAQRAVR